MTQVPKIFTVYEWYQDAGLYYLNLHLVAGFDSQDAESRITGEFPGSSRVFITTDFVNEMHHNPSIRLHSTHYTNESHTKDSYNNWVKQMNFPYYNQDLGITYTKVRQIF